MTEDLLFTSDSLASFLREMDDLDDHTTYAPAFAHECGREGHGFNSPASLSGAVLPPTKVKRRTATPVEAHTAAALGAKPRHGDCVKKLRTQIRSLYQQLRGLQHDPSGGAAGRSARPVND